MRASTLRRTSATVEPEAEWDVLPSDRAVILRRARVAVEPSEVELATARGLRRLRTAHHVKLTDNGRTQNSSINYSTRTVKGTGPPLAATRISLRNRISFVCLFVHGTGPRHRNDLVSGRLALASSRISHFSHT